MSKSWGKFIEEEEASGQSNDCRWNQLRLRFKHNNSKTICLPVMFQFIQSLANYTARTTIVLGDKGKSVFRQNICIRV